METIEEKQTERLLIYSNDPEISRINQDLQSCLMILNKLHEAGLSKEEIEELTVSKSKIDRYIFDAQLKANKEFAKLIKARIKGVEAELPEDLERLKYALLAWCNVPGRKFENIRLADKWEVDSEALEGQLIRSRNLVYIEGEQVLEYRKIEALISLLREFGVPWNHLYQSSALNQIMVATGQSITPRWQYFSNRG